MPPTPPIDPAMRLVIDECWRCHTTCLETVRHAIAAEGRAALPARVVTLLDCADLCRTAADTVARGSRHAAIACGACAAMCRACAAECRADADDAQLAACADACDRCAAACSSVVR